jgi:hypothetical protein
VTHENFASDMDRIERDLRAVIRPSRRWRWIVPVILVLLAAALGVGVYRFDSSSWWMKLPGEGPEDVVQPGITERAFTSFLVNTDLPGGD